MIERGAFFKTFLSLNEINSTHFNALSMAYIGYYKQCLQCWLKSVARWPCPRPREAFGLAACIAYNDYVYAM